MPSACWRVSAPARNQEVALPSSLKKSSREMRPKSLRSWSYWSSATVSKIVDHCSLRAVLGSEMYQPLDVRGSEELVAGSDDSLCFDNPVQDFTHPFRRLRSSGVGVRQGPVSSYGRPDYDPANLLKICQYGYVQRNRHVH